MRAKDGREYHLGPHRIPGDNVRAWVPRLELLWGVVVRAHNRETLALSQAWHGKPVAM